MTGSKPAVNGQSSKLRIASSESPPERAKVSALEKLCLQIGHRWPPRSELELINILSKAGWNKQDIDRAIAFFYPRKTSEQGLPEHYVSTGEATGEIKPRSPEAENRALTAEEHAEVYGQPNFSAMVVAGLQRYVETRGSDPRSDSQNETRVGSGDTQPAKVEIVSSRRVSGTSNDQRIALQQFEVLKLIIARHFDNNWGVLTEDPFTQTDLSSKLADVFKKTSASIGSSALTVKRILNRLFEIDGQAASNRGYKEYCRRCGDMSSLESWVKLKTGKIAEVMATVKRATKPEIFGVCDSQGCDDNAIRVLGDRHYCEDCFQEWSNSSS